MKIRTVTIDFWGTLILDSPAGDERYEERRLSGFAAVLREQGLEPHCSAATDGANAPDNVGRRTGSYCPSAAISIAATLRPEYR